MCQKAESTTSPIMHRGIDQNIFLQKNFVKACVGARRPDWGFPEPKWCYLSYEVPFLFFDQKWRFFPIFIFPFFSEITPKNENVVMGKNHQFA